MSLMRHEFTPFRKITTEFSKAVVMDFNNDVARTSHYKMRTGMEASRGGKVYRKKGGGIHRASAPGAYPAVMTGRLIKSIRTQVSMAEVVIGTTEAHARFMYGTKRGIAKRKMSPNALRDGASIARSRIGHFAKFRIMGA